MKRMLGLGLVGVMAMAVAATAEVETSVAVDVPVLSAYVWRGQVLNDEAVAQPGLTAGIGGFTVNAWSSMPRARCRIWASAAPATRWW